MVTRNNTSAIPGLMTGYWAESSRPLASLVFLAPMLLAYEGGLWIFGSRSLRNGADIWLRQSLESAGFSQYFLLPLLTCGVLLGWHHFRRERWRVGSTVLLGMLVESLFLGLVLLCVANWQSLVFATATGQSNVTLKVNRATAEYVLPYLGAGIYEELLFRLLLVPVLASVCRFAGATRPISVVCAVVAASLLFAAAHYQLHVDLGIAQLAITRGDHFDLTSFLFRAAAGIVFSMLFLYRGFGIAAGSHALYDILVATW